jgi:hypothetical protein
LPEHSVRSIFKGFFIEPLKMDLTEGSETSAKLNLMPGKYQKENIRDSEHGENLKSRIPIVCFFYRVWGNKKTARKTRRVLLGVPPPATCRYYYYYRGNGCYRTGGHRNDCTRKIQKKK